MLSSGKLSHAKREKNPEKRENPKSEREKRASHTKRRPSTKIQDHVFFLLNSGLESDTG